MQRIALGDQDEPVQLGILIGQLQLAYCVGEQARQRVRLGQIQRVRQHFG